MAEQETIHSDDRYARISLNKETGSITLQWKGYVPSEAYRRILDTGVQLALEHQVKFWLADLRQMGVILRDDERWTTSDFMPRMAKAGLERLAILTSTDLFNQMSVDRIMDTSIPILPFQVAYFDDIVTARVWLQGKEAIEA